MRFLSVLVFFVFVAGGFCLVEHRLGPLDPPRRHPLAFNHEKHIQNGMSCSDCHTAVTTAEGASLPRMEDCAQCHENAIGDSLQEQKLQEIKSAGGELNWDPVTGLPAGGVRFPHARHVVSGKLDCVPCHGQMAERQTPPERPPVKLSMSFCIDCHTRQGASTDCLACHR